MEAQQESKVNKWRVVWLAGNRIGDEGARALGDALKTNTTLTVLDLHGGQQDHKETQRESKATTMARGVTGRQQDWC